MPKIWIDYEEIPGMLITYRRCTMGHAIHNLPFTVISVIHVSETLKEYNLLFLRNSLLPPKIC